MDRLGRTIRAAERKGPTRYANGVARSAPTSGRIAVEVGGHTVSAVIPGSFRANLADGQELRLAVQGSTYVVDSVLSALTPPTVAASPADASANSASSCSSGHSRSSNRTTDRSALTRAMVPLTWRSVHRRACGDAPPDSHRASG